MNLQRTLWHYVAPALRSPRTRHRSGHDLGFTLTEILVSVIIAGIIMSGLMTLMVELLTSDARETARTETQREMQMALDYISADIREAFYVYDGKCLEGEQDTCGSGLFNSINIPANSVPVLAFWKLEDLPQAVLNNNCANFAQLPQGIPCVSGRSNTLVVYYLTSNEGNNANAWSGMGRLQRTAYRQFNSNGTQNANFVDPTDSEIENMTFDNWPAGQAVTLPTPITLVDFVDDRPMSDIAAAQDVDQGMSVDCPDGYNLTPDDSTLENNGFGGVRNFYACVLDEVGRRSNIDDSNSDPDTAFNQKVILFLRGNAAGKPGIRSANEGFMPAIQTQVLNRSVRRKSPRRF